MVSSSETRPPYFVKNHGVTKGRIRNRQQACAQEDDSSDGERREDQAQRDHRSQIVNEAGRENRLAIFRLIEPQFEHHRIHHGHRSGRKRHASKPRRTPRPPQHIMRDHGRSEEWREESHQSHGRRFFPFFAEHVRVEFGPCQEREDDSARAGQKRDPFGLGVQHVAPNQSADDQLGDGADDDLRQRR